MIPVGKIIGGLSGPVQAIREASPQALHHFTQTDQVNQLVGASEAEADLGFMARTMTLCSLPRTNPGNRLQYKRVNGPYKLIMIAGGDNKLPFGNLPRLLLVWVCTEAVRTQSRELILGSSLSGFMREIGLDSSSGAGRRRLRTQRPASAFLQDAAQYVFGRHGTRFVVRAAVALFGRLHQIPV